MESENHLSKPRYDISMSKRTRKPLNFLQEQINPFEACSSMEKAPVEVVNSSSSIESLFTTGADEHEKQENKTTSKDCDKRKCLKQLIESRNSLGQHFTKEEKQLQLVIKQPEDSFNGFKLRKMVSRYGKFLSHMIKIKRNSHRKKPVLPIAK